MVCFIGVMSIAANTEDANPYGLGSALSLVFPLSSVFLYSFPIGLYPAEEENKCLELD